jgi:hypothetical protein
LLVVHGENWSVFAASVLFGLGSVATPAIVTFLIRNKTSDAVLSLLLYGRHREPGSRPAQRTRGRGILADRFGPWASAGSPPPTTSSAGRG